MKTLVRRLTPVLPLLWLLSPTVALTGMFACCMVPDQSGGEGARAGEEALIGEAPVIMEKWSGAVLPDPCCAPILIMSGLLDLWLSA